MNQNEQKLFNFIDLLLINDWDPLNVKDQYYSRDEYKFYLPVLFRMVLNGSSVEKIANYLNNIQICYMNEPSNIKKCTEIAQKAVDFNQNSID